MRLAIAFAKSVALYLAIVIGGLTLFLILAPLFGYLPYSDRPGPGWYGSFPAMGWTEFWRNVAGAVEFGLFFAIVFIIAGIICVLAVRGLERLARGPLVVRIGGGIISALVTGYCMLGAGWYISAGMPLLIVVTGLGALAGAWFLPRRSKFISQGA